MQSSAVPANIETLLKYAKENHLENLIAVDNTASSVFVENYELLAENGFDLVSSNKILTPCQSNVTRTFVRYWKIKIRNTCMRRMWEQVYH